MPKILAQETSLMSIPPIRIGLGFDTHRLGEGGPLRIGGIDIEAGVHAIGHSDADILLHAITDALLVAIAHGDIGRLFPDNAEENRDRDSQDFVNKAMELVRENNMAVVNIDCVILAQQPKMAPHIDRMREVIASLIDASVGQVSIKAKTGEKVGPVGRGEAISARVVVLLSKSQ